MEGVTGKVAAVLSGAQIIINRGASQGVTPGMRFEVLMKGHPTQVFDPDQPTECLGSVAVAMASVVADEVRERIAVCRRVPTVDDTWAARGEWPRVMGPTSLSVGQVVRQVVTAPGPDLSVALPPWWYPLWRLFATGGAGTGERGG